MQRFRLKKRWLTSRIHFENFEEVAERGDMDAKELKDTLDSLVPVFDNL